MHGLRMNAIKIEQVLSTDERLLFAKNSDQNSW